MKTVRSRAFTLIEILVVLGIILLLAAILLPVFGRVRDGGRRAACQSNLKQIGLGLIQYTQDNDEILCADWYSNNPDLNPHPTTRDGSAAVEYKWMDAIYPYTKNGQVFTCPAATGQRARPWIYYKFLMAANLQADGTTTDYGSYVMLHGYGPLLGTALMPAVSHPHVMGGPYLINMSQGAVPATTAWVADGQSLDAADATDYSGTFYAQCSNSRDLLETFARHLNTVNVLYLDGHVKAVREEVLNKRSASGVISAVTLADD